MTLDTKYFNYYVGAINLIKLNAGFSIIGKIKSVKNNSVYVDKKRCFGFESNSH